MQSDSILDDLDTIARMAILSEAGSQTTEI